MTRRLRFSISLMSVMLIPLTLRTLILSPTYARGFISRDVMNTQKYQSPLTSKLINNVNLSRPYWWGGTTGCDTNYPYVGGSVQLVNMGTPTSFRGTPMCGPMPENYTTNIDFPYNLPLGDPKAVQVNDFECTEAAMRYMYLAYGQHPYVANGGNVVDNYGISPVNGTLLKKVPNVAGSGNAPSPGDVMSLTNSDVGHVVIVSNVSIDKSGVGNISIVDENGNPGSNQTNGTGTATFPVNNWYIDGSSEGGIVEAWLHPNTLVPTTNPPLNGYQLYGVDTAEYGADKVAADNVWAVGNSTTTSGITQTLIERWNGANWTTIPNSPNMGTGDSNYLTSIAALSQNNIWAVGYYYDNGQGGSQHTLLLHYNGKTWIASTQGLGILYAITRVSSTEAWAVGQSDNDTMLTSHFVAGNWSTTIDTTQSIILNAVSAHAANDVWAVGETAIGTIQTVTLHWTGGPTWTSLTSPNPGNYSSSLQGVTAIASNNVWAVGKEEGNNGIQQAFIIHGTGSPLTWGTPIIFNIGTSSTFYAVKALSSKNIWAVGSYNNGSVNSLVYHYNGSGWKQMSSPSTGSVLNSITVNTQNGNVWTVGQTFSNQGIIEYFN